jgi:hypothetical protein
MKRYFSVSVLMVAAVSSARSGDVSISTLHEAMQQVIAPQAQIVWNVGNAAFDDDGRLDGRKVTDAGWKEVASAAHKLKDAAQQLAQAEGIVVAAPGERLQDEGYPQAANAQAVQEYIDANPRSFRRRANALRAAAGELVQASAEHNAGIFSRVSNGLDEICEDCHERFWYPEPKK